MKRLSILVFFSLLAVTIHAQDSFQQAADAYQSGDYITAIDIYEAALLKGEGNEAIYYNLGNAYYQYGNLGLAMLNYQRAVQYSPRDSKLTAQIRRVQSERVNTGTEDRDWLNISATLSANILTIYEMSSIVFVLWLIFFVLLGLPIKSVFWRIPTLAVGTVLLMAVLLLGSRLYVETHRPSAVILSVEAQAWSGPGEDYLALFIVYEAAEIRVLEKHGDWLKFALPNGQQGWILKENVGYSPTW
jgi:tetratricopeptide (TPR) repeat protein